jgi:hypothetical protein
MDEDGSQAALPHARDCNAFSSSITLTVRTDTPYNSVRLISGLTPGLKTKATVPRIIMRQRVVASICAGRGVARRDRRLGADGHEWRCVSSEEMTRCARLTGNLTCKASGISEPHLMERPPERQRR